MHSEVHRTPAPRRSAVGAERRTIIFCVFLSLTNRQEPHTLTPSSPTPEVCLCIDTSGSLHPNEKTMNIEHPNLHRTAAVSPDQPQRPRPPSTPERNPPFLIVILILIPFSKSVSIRVHPWLILHFCCGSAGAGIRRPEFPQPLASLTNHTSHSQGVPQGVHKPFTNLHKPFTNQYKALQAFTNHHNQILTYEN